MAKPESTGGGYRRLFLRLVTPAFKASGGKFEDMVVYSFLCLRLKNRRGNAATIQSISTYTRLAARTVRGSRDRLLSMGLIETQTGRLMAKEPQGEQAKWFHWRRHAENRPWFVRMNYVPCLIPASACSLSIREAAILCFIWSWQRRGRCLGRGVRQSSLGKQLMLGRNTVSKAIRAMQKHGVLDDEGRLKADPAELEGFWIDKRLPKLKHSKLKSAAHHMFSLSLKEHYKDRKAWLFPSTETLFRWIEGHETNMSQAGYSAAEIESYWIGVSESLEDRATRLEFFILKAFDPTFAWAESRTNDNRLAGKFGGANSLGLLKQQSVTIARLINTRVELEGMDVLIGWQIDMDAVKKL